MLFFPEIDHPYYQKPILETTLEIDINNLIISNPTRSSNLTHATFSDFKNFTMEGLEIVHVKSESYLRLKTIKNYTWLEQKSNITPEKRGECSLAPIHGTDNVLLFGGWNWSKPHQHNTTWIFTLNNNTWWQRDTIEKPPSREQQALAPICGDDKVLLFGGSIMSGPTDDTWIYSYSEDRWVDKTVTLTKSPSKRILHAMATIYGTRKILLYGGWDGQNPKNDTWIYDEQQNTWTELMLPKNPESRFIHSMAGVYGDDKVVLFGGKVWGSPINDTWVFDLSDNTWTNKTQNITLAPSNRFYSGLSSIPESGEVVLFGGQAPFWSDDTWIYNVSRNNWTKIIPNNQPPLARGTHGMTYIDGTDKILVYGGLGNGGVYNDTWILDTSRFFCNGTVVSSPRHLGSKFSYNNIYYNGSNTVNTSIEFQLRTAPTKDDLNQSKFLGPDGTENSFYNQSVTKICLGHNNDSWIQYKGYLTTKHNNETPILRNVTIIYNYWPDTILEHPFNNSLTSNNKPNFQWTFNDVDSEYQSAFQVLISTKVNFSTIDFNSGVQFTKNNTWQFPNGTAYSEISDGIWCWKVRTIDNDGDWGLYSTPFKFKLDTRAPSSEIIIPKNDTYYGYLYKIYGTALENFNGTGLDKVEISIENLTENKYWNKNDWTDSEYWFSVNGKEAWTYDVSNIEWSSGISYGIRSRAVDMVDNIEYPPQKKIFTFDNENVLFSNPIPANEYESLEEEVTVGVTISDNTSGINASTIKYSTSTDAGNYWSTWKTVEGFQNGNNIDVKLNLTFPNGTGNRIRWRAYDITGNGPTYSDEYVINVNIPKPPIVPEIKLTAPGNNSIITTTSVELAWEVINNYHPNIEFDIKLGTTNPPQNFIEQDYTDTKLIVDELQNGETYYWTIIPRLNKINGTCLSGVWSFTVDIPLPRAILKTPVNNSEITSKLPTLVWSIDYGGTETVTYNVYFGTNKDPPLEFEKSTTIYYAINNALEDNTTYYWKIVPSVGEYEGFSSEIWSFSVKLKDETTPTFGIDLYLKTNPLEIKPGEVKFVSAIVTNLGEQKDNYTVQIGDINNSKLTAENYRQDTLEIESGKNKEFLIMVSIKDGSKPGFENISITAKSNLAEKYNLNVQDSQVLMINILEKDNQNGKEQGQPISIFYFSILLLIIILIIISIIILIIVRKKSSKKESEVEEIQDIQPEAPPDSIFTPEPEPVPLPQQDVALEE
jgi:hypothetical protein